VQQVQQREDASQGHEKVIRNLLRRLPRMQEQVPSTLHHVQLQTPKTKMMHAMLGQELALSSTLHLKNPKADD
jgi:hypothetical protein